MIVQRSFLYFLIGLLYVSCNSPSGKRDISQYYLPVNELESGLLYEYVGATNDSLPPYYYYFRSDKENGATRINGSYYNYNMQLEHQLSELVVDNGVLLESMKMMVQDSIISDVQIEYGNTFPFLVKDASSLFLYKVSWKDPIDQSIEYTVTRNRFFAGDTTYNVSGVEKECIRFNYKELIDLNQEGHLEMNTSGYELYAKDLGLVYTEKTLNKETTVQYKLNKVISGVELRKQGIVLD